MKTGTKSQIIELIKKNKGAKPDFLTKRLGITPQAVHRHLRQLCQIGAIERVGSPPASAYRWLGNPSASHELAGKMRVLQEIFGSHPAVQLVTVFGSQVRGAAREGSDVDVLVWLDEAASFSRHDLWAYWDRQAARYAWKDEVSIVVKPLRSELHLHTLLLDFPEEHLLVYDRATWFTTLRKAVIDWRHKWGAEKLPSFGGKHAWRYSTKVKKLSDIDFRLELKHVA